MWQKYWEPCLSWQKPGSGGRSRGRRGTSTALFLACGSPFCFVGELVTSAHAKHPCSILPIVCCSQIAVHCLFPTAWLHSEVQLWSGSVRGDEDIYHVTNILVIPLWQCHRRSSESGVQMSPQGLRLTGLATSRCGSELRNLVRPHRRPIHAQRMTTAATSRMPLAFMLHGVTSRSQSSFKNHNNNAAC